jgi:redox-sensitive bicupin YhaK (pirin superfamily)
MATATERSIERVITAHKQLEGGGFVVRRPLPSAGLEHIDPFLLLDELGPVDYAPGEAVGAPDHPHRGFETVTYMLEGAFEHEDSAGHRGRLGPGDVQWMTAGAGIVHSEEPARDMVEKGGRSHGFQIWVNLPAKHKMTKPRYQEVQASGIPRAQTADGLARGVIIAGEALGVRAVIDTLTPIVYQDWTLDAGADVSIAIAAEQRAMVYAFEGAVEIGGQQVRDGQLAVLGDGDVVRLRAAQAGRVLLLAGVPHREPVARYGPFVMNNAQELEQAFRDFRSGRMGEITRTAQIG